MDLVWGSSQVQPSISGMSWVTQGPLPIAKQELNNIISLNIWRSQVGFRMRPPQTMSHWSQHINTSPSWQQKLISLQWFCSKRNSHRQRLSQSHAPNSADNTNWKDYRVGEGNQVQNLGPLLNELWSKNYFPFTEGLHVCPLWNTSKMLPNLQKNLHTCAFTIGKISWLQMLPKLRINCT
jgi:hypothetical protein